MGRCGSTILGQAGGPHAMRFLRLLYLLASGITSVFAQGYDVSTAFGDGRSLGSGAVGGAFQGIGTGIAATIVPGYGQSASQTSISKGAWGSFPAPGSQR